MFRKLSLALLFGALVLCYAGCAKPATKATTAAAPATAKPAISKTNLALNKPAFCSSVEKANQYNGHRDLLPALAVDGDKSTRWGSDWINDTNRDAAWVYVDLGSSMTIQEVKIFWDTHPNCMAVTFDIDISDDASTWTVVKAITGNVNPDDDIMFDNPVKARYVKIDCKKRFSQYGFSIDEIEIY
jgi:nuclear transport factor 2 (NTF2) superfamily protein